LEQAGVCLIARLVVDAESRSARQAVFHTGEDSIFASLFALLKRGILQIYLHNYIRYMAGALIKCHDSFGGLLTRVLQQTMQLYAPGQK